MKLPSYLLLFTLALVAGSCSESTETQDLIDAAAKKAVKSKQVFTFSNREIDLNKAKIYLHTTSIITPAGDYTGWQGKLFAITDGVITVNVNGGTSNWLANWNLEGETYLFVIGLMSSNPLEVVGPGEYVTTELFNTFDTNTWLTTFHNLPANGYFAGYIKEIEGPYGFYFPELYSMDHSWQESNGFDVVDEFISIGGGTNPGDQIEISFVDLSTEIVHDYNYNSWPWPTEPTKSSLYIKGKIDGSYVFDLGSEPFYCQDCTNLPSSGSGRVQNKIPYMIEFINKLKKR